MLRIRSIFVLICCLGTAVTVSGQNSVYRWSMSVGGGMVQYQGTGQSGKLNYSNFDPVFELGVSRYLDKAFDLRSQLLLSPNVRFPVDADQFRSSFMIDWNYQMVIKLYGIIFPEDAVVGPFLLLGVGGSYVEDNPDAYFPLGGGLRFRLSPKSSLRLQAIQKLSFNNDYQHWLLSAAVEINLWPRRDRPSMQPEYINSPIPTAAMAPQDMDRDGVADIFDDCPQIPGPISNKGCPIPTTGAPAPVAETVPVLPVPIPLPPEEEPGPESYSCRALQEKINLVGHPFFGLNKYELDGKSKKLLDQIARLLIACPEARLIIQGHTDGSGIEQTNVVLSVKRANEAKFYLVKQHKIRQSRIVAQGYGQSRPIRDNNSDEGRRLNRRLEFKIEFE